MSRIPDERVAEVWERLALEARDAGHHDVTTDQCREAVEVFRSLLHA